MNERAPILPSRPWYEARWVRIFLSLALLGWLASSLHFDAQQWVTSTRHVVWWPIALALLLRPLAVWCNAWHTSLLLESADSGLSLRDVWSAAMFGEMLSRFVPGNLGTLAYVAKLSNHAGDAVLAQLLDRVLFLLFLLLAAAGSLVLAGHPRLGLLATGAFLCALVGAALVYTGVLRWVPLTLAQRSSLERMLQRSAHWRAPFALACSLSLALMTLLFWLLVVACGAFVGLFESVAAVTLVTIGAALPFSINGIGIREWVFVALLAERLPAKETVVTLAAITYLVGFASALVGVVTWALMGQKTKPADAQS